MIRTPLCDLLGIESPIIQAGMGPFGSGAELAAAVSNVGALGTYGAAARSVERLKDDIARIRDLTDRPFCVNLVFNFLTEESFSSILEARPPVFSLALGDPGDLVKRAHDAGIRFVQQVHTVAQARQMAERGVDVIIAQGTEAGGFVGRVAAMPLVPQVVDAVSPIPVVAAGGIFDGRGLAAALALGAQGVNVGTRFLASEEADLDGEWKDEIIEARSEDTERMDVWPDIFPPVGPGGFDVAPRALATPFVRGWQADREGARGAAEAIREEITTAVMEGRMKEKVPFTGQTAGGITEILPAGEIVRRFVAEAEDAIRRASGLIS